MVGCGDLRLPGTTTYGLAECGQLSIAADFFVDGCVCYICIVISDGLTGLNPVLCRSSEPNGTWDPAAFPRAAVGGGGYS